jgi:heterodisulfide reductase subunit B
VKYAFYPGCTQESTAEEFGLSSKTVCHALGIELEEIPDWNCCGASSGHFLDDELAHALPARNLAIAEKQGLDTAIVCAACYLRLRATRQKVQESPGFRKKLSDKIGMSYEAKNDVKHLLDIIVNDLGLEEVKKKVTKPLKGLRLAPYYGCYLVRPPKVVGFDDPENPVIMDRLLESLGAEALDWGAKVDCCGGSLILSKEEIAIKLIGGVIEKAREVEAEAIVVACPMCHANLDMRQSGKNKVPILYFTELIGLAMGIPEAVSWFKKHMVSPLKLLQSYNLI